MTDKRHEFGKRRPLPPVTRPATPPVKRSGHVALLLTGTLAVGGSAYALMPRTNPCEPASPGMAAPAQSPADGACTSRGSSSGGSGGGGGSGHGFRFFSGDSDSRGSSSTQISDASASHVTRGGFGSFAHAFGFSRGG